MISETDGVLRVSELGDGSVTFYSNHPVAADIARDLTCCLPTTVKCDISVYIGSHRFRSMKDTNVSIGLQTEHFLDEAGSPLWGAFQPKRLRNAVKRYDHVLDLSPLNKDFYSEHEIDQKTVTFGPSIFPANPVKQILPGDGFLFVGRTSQYRRDCLAGLNAKHGVSVLEFDGFGELLNAKIRESMAVVNIHVAPGTYSEYPRLLKTYLNGKVFISDTLALPLRAGQHYLGLDADLSSKKLDKQLPELFKRLSEEFVTKNSLSGYLSSLGLC